jgi:hypothetical protein
VARLVLCQTIFFFQDDDIGTGTPFQQFHCGGKSDDAAANDTVIKNQETPFVPPQS